MKNGVSDGVPYVEWNWYSFSQLSARHLYEILRVRQEVFVVEQNCVYLDADEIDCKSYHLIGRVHQEIAVYARLCPPGSRFADVSIGRLLTVSRYRGHGLANQAVDLCLFKAKEFFKATRIRLSAQLYLVEFYSGFGFVEVGDSYDEDGIEHIDMLLRMETI